MIYLVIAIIIGLTSPRQNQEPPRQDQDPPRQESFEGFISGIRANAVKGEVFYQRGDGKFNLEPGHKLEEGDFIKTASDSYAELLLQPGSYLRVGGDTELQIFSDQNEKMRFKLDRGSINLEILSQEGQGMFLYDISLSLLFELTRVITPNAEVFIRRSGIFRINSLGTGKSDVIVREGEAVINGQRVKEKRKGVASSQGVTITEMNSKLEDSFDAWSRERAEELVDANRLLKRESPWAKERKDDEETVVDLPEEGTQPKSHRLISARPGAVNFAEAGVEFKRSTKDWEALTEKSQLESGDKLRTSAHSFAELSMLPDINLRLDSKSEVLLEKLSNEWISVKLLQGSAILDVGRFEGEGEELPQVALAAASTSVLIADAGNYRIDITPNGDEIIIRHGKVRLKERVVKACRRITAGTVSECYKKPSDNFDVWSEYRGEGKIFGDIAMSSYLARARRARFKKSGFWFQYPGKTSYTFVPFTSTAYRSPYGGNYSTVLSPRGVPRIRPESRKTPPFGQMPGSQTARPQP